MKALVELIAASLVDHPEAVRARELPGPRETRIQLHVAPEDVGKIIGREGRTVRAIRTLLAVAGRKTRRTVKLEIPS